MTPSQFSLLVAVRQDLEALAEGKPSPHRPRAAATAERGSLADLQALEHMNRV